MKAVVSFQMDRLRGIGLEDPWWGYIPWGEPRLSWELVHAEERPKMSRGVCRRPGIGPEEQNDMSDVSPQQRGSRV